MAADRITDYLDKIAQLANNKNALEEKMKEVHEETTDGLADQVAGNLEAAISHLHNAQTALRQVVNAAQAIRENYDQDKNRQPTWPDLLK